MNHLPYIAASYGIFTIVAVWLAAVAAFRLRRATARLRAVDPRAGTAA
jgi:hypothetical protein